MRINRKQCCEIISDGAIRCFSALPENEIKDIPVDKKTGKRSLIPSDYRHIYQEFLPDPTVRFRNSVRERLERMDMLERRSQLNIPEFYVGSILAVTSSDPHSQGKTSKMSYTILNDPESNFNYLQIVLLVFALSVNVPVYGLSSS